jgi:LPPG:FO 2-phospho-L-lactate transferase
MIVVLCGGVGGSRFVRALASVVGQKRITAIINTADDEEFHGLYVSPDPDIVTYALAGEVDEQRGWGFRDETFRGLEHLRRFGRETWFQIGDRDLATHLHRTRRLREGASLSVVMAEIAGAFGITARLLPMSDDPVRTMVETNAGDLAFQRFLVERHARDAVRGVRFVGADAARPAPGVLEAIAAAEAIFIAPSNPIASIGPILAVTGIRDAIESAPATKVAISPIIGGRSLQPPAAEMMAGLGRAVDVAGVADLYKGLIDTLLVDDEDVASAAAVEAAGIRCIVSPTLMHDEASGRSLANAALEAAGLPLM